MSNYIACNACVTPLDCGFTQKCWNMRVTQHQIKVELAKFDAMVTAKPVWAPEPVKPVCAHTPSPHGICTKCGHWL